MLTIDSHRTKAYWWLTIGLDSKFIVSRQTPASSERQWTAIAYGQGGLKLEINIPVLYRDIFRCFLSKHPDIQEDILSAVKQRLEECNQELKTATLQVLWLDSICKASRRKHDNKIQNEWNSYPITRTSRPRAQEFVWKTRYSWTSKSLTFFSVLTSC